MDDSSNSRSKNNDESAEVMNDIAESTTTETITEATNEALKAGVIGNKNYYRALDKYGGISLFWGPLAAKSIVLIDKWWEQKEYTPPKKYDMCYGSGNTNLY
jgi:hypothetical protein